MLEISRKKLGLWLVRLGVKIGNIKHLDYYQGYKFREWANERELSKENFVGFYAIEEQGLRKISEDIKQIDPEAIKFIENN